MAQKYFRAGKTALLLVLWFAFLPMGRLHAATGDAGVVLALAGQCFVETGQSRLPLKSGDVVHIGDMVDAPAGGRLKLRLNDGSVLSLGSGTRTRIDAAEANGTANRTVKLTLMSGLLRAVVTSFSQPSTFEIKTATGVAGVRSTDWFIEAVPASTQVGVLEGRVVLTSVTTGRTVAIPARWGARVEDGRDPVPARVWSTAEFNNVIGRTDVNQGP